MKLSQISTVAILMVFAFCPLFITTQAAFASPSADRMTFTSGETEQGRPYRLIALITVSALFGFAYQRIPVVQSLTKKIFRMASQGLGICWAFCTRKKLLNS